MSLLVVVSRLLIFTVVVVVVVVVVSCITLVVVGICYEAKLITSIEHTSVEAPAYLPSTRFRADDRTTRSRGADGAIWLYSTVNVIPFFSPSYCSQGFSPDLGDHVVVPPFFFLFFFFYVQCTQWGCKRC